MNLRSFWRSIGALPPSAGVGFLFFIVIKAILEGDRRERLAHSQWESQQQSDQRPPDTHDRQSGTAPQQQSTQTDEES